MASFQSFFISTFFFFFFFLLPSTASSAKNCKTSYCDDFSPPQVKFPFQLNTTSQDKCSGHPRFSLSCNNQSQTILTLPYSGDFVVLDIDYLGQVMIIDDPDDCLPRRFLNQNFTLTGSPFHLSDINENITLYNCSYNPIYAYGRYPCLGDNFTFSWTAMGQCQEVITAPLFDGLYLSWSTPEHECFTSRIGLSRSAKYGIALGVGIHGLLCLIWLTYYQFKRVTVDNERPQRNTQLSTSTVTHQTTFVMGLDRATIESYQKTLLGKSLELPNSNDNICPICLSDYQPKETLRTIPKCNHYFHANCIDEWLKINAACPICRNSHD